MDIKSPKARSLNMAAVRSKNTKPEIAVRKLLHAAGYRFRLHSKDLPGSPDIVLPKLKTVVFVNGCFWHRHPGCRFAAVPATRSDFWIHKFEENVQRDKRNYDVLRTLGWRVIVIWECEISSISDIRKFLDEQSDVP